MKNNKNMLKNRVTDGKNSLYKPCTAIFLIVLMLTLTQIMLVSADWTIDNIKDYDTNTNTLKVTDNLGLGNTLIEWKRTTPNPNPIIRSASTDKKDWRAVVCYENLYLDYGLEKQELFTKQELINQKTGEDLNRDYEWRVKYLVPYQQMTYKEECELIDTAKNGTVESCVSVEDKLVTRYKTQYKVIDDLSDIRINDEVCLFTYVGANDWGEQIPSFAGKSFPEDSEWNESLNTDLNAYYTLDSDGTDSLGTNDLSVTGGSFVSGKVGNAWDSATYSSDMLDANTVLTPLADDFTINIWFSNNDDSTYPNLWSQSDGSTAYRTLIQYRANTDTIKYYLDGEISMETVSTFTGSDWHMITLTRNGSNFTLYLDGNAEVSDTSSVSLANLETRLGGNIANSVMNGKLDEAGFWNRSLTNDEVTQLYNGGTGITYSAGGGGGSAPVVNIVYPTATSYATATHDLNYTTNSTDSCWYSFDAGATNSSNVAAGTNWTGLTASEGSNSWYVYCNNTDGIGSDSVTFSVDSTNPTVTITELGVIDYHKKGNNLTINYSISDTNIDSCLLEYAGTNSSLNCSANGYYINTTSTDYKIVKIYANDTLANSNSSNMNWSYNVFENSRTFTASTTQTTLESYALNVTLGTGVTLSSGALIYNGTSYAADITAIGSNRNFSRELTIPSVSGSVNVTFYWSLTTSEGVINTTSSTQEIKEIDIDDCTTNTHQILNYSVYDEDTRSFLTNTTWNNSADIYLRLGADFSGVNYQEYSSTSGANPIKICLSNAIAAGENYRLDSIVKFNAADHVTEYHYLENITLNSSSVPKNIALYDLATNNSQEFLITFKDSNFIPLGGAIIQITRQYLALGQFLTIESVKTDSDGKTIGHFVLNDEVYTIYVKKDGVLRAVFQNVRTFCSNILTGDCQIVLNEQSSTANPSSFKDYLGVIGTESYNDTSKIYQFSFTTSDGSSKTINVSVYKYDLLLNTTICSEELTDSSGTISCTIPAAYYNNTALVKILVDGEAYSSNIFYIAISKSSQQNPTRFILAFFLVITIPFLAFTSGPMTLVLFILGLVLAASLFLIDFGGYIGAFSAFMWFIIAAIILLIKASKRRQQ